MGNETIEAKEDVELNLGVTSEYLMKLNPGQEERLNEAKIHEIQHKLNLEMEKLELQRTIEEQKLDIERSKAKTEKATLWARVGLTAVTLTSEIALGVLYLKANMKYGGMLGKDGKKWFDDIKRIKL